MRFEEILLDSRGGKTKTFIFLPGEPSVHDGVAEGGGHGEDVEAEEGEVVVGPAGQGELQVLQQVDQVEGEPADDEHHQHGE